MKPKRRSRSVNHAALAWLAGLCAVLAAGCASSGLRYTELKSGEIHQGQGGAVSSEAGIEIWTDGTPMRQYQIIGIIQITPQNQKGMHLPKLWPHADTDTEQAREAKSHGGDAVVIVQGPAPSTEDSSNDETDTNSDDAGSGGHSRPVTAYVVKYVGPPPPD